MIVTDGGKNIYPEDIEAVFDGLPVKEYCVFAANFLWPQKTLGDEMLVLVARLGPRASKLMIVCARRSCRETGGSRTSSAWVGICCGRKIFRGPQRSRSSVENWRRRLRAGAARAQVVENKQASGY
jgi:acyl-CoA synthetase (AMP-forming)/AMP-acid ligase II